MAVDWHPLGLLKVEHSFRLKPATSEPCLLGGQHSEEFMTKMPDDFWETTEYSKREYEAEPITDNLVSLVEENLGYKLPPAYVELMRTQNGGIPKRKCYRTKERTSWAHDHIAITGIYGISLNKSNALCGKFSSEFWINEWGYPALGVYFADCPSAGHDMLCLDYSQRGPYEQPRVVHVDQELDYSVTVLAETFEEFILGLEPDENFAVD